MIIIILNFTEKQSKSLLHRAVVESDTYTPLKLALPEPGIPEHPILERLTAWTQKALHERYPNEIRQPNVDKVASLRWLTDGVIFPDTEGFMVAIQDQVVLARNYCKYIIRDGTEDDSCRRCHTAPETIQHIVPGCPSLAPVEYKRRHDLVAGLIHQELALRYILLQERTPYYKYTPACVLQNEVVTLYWDRTVLTDKTVRHNRPDLIVVDRKNTVAKFVDVAIPCTHNLEQTTQDMATKYVELAGAVKD